MIIKQLRDFGQRMKKVANKYDEEVQAHEIRPAIYSKADKEELVAGIEHLDEKENNNYSPYWNYMKRHLSEPEESGAETDQAGVKRIR